MRLSCALIAFIAILMSSVVALAGLKDPTDPNCHPDGDGDGYYASSSQPPQPDGTCLQGWMRRVRGASADCDDTDSSVHPRRREISFNQRDDNCNGLTDEPVFVSPHSNVSGITATSFPVVIRVNDRQTRDAGEGGGLWLHLSWLDLTDTSVYYSRWMQVKMQRYINTWLVKTTLDGLLPGRIYQVMAKFGVKKPPAEPTQPQIGAQPLHRLRSDSTLARFMERPAAKVSFVQGPVIKRSNPFWLPDNNDLDPTKESPIILIPFEPDAEPDIHSLGYATGLPYYSVTLPQDATEIDVRGRTVMQAIAEFYRSSIGEIGYLGWLRIDGTRYGAERGEFWCSEFFSWVTSTVPLNSDIGVLEHVSDIISYFSNRGDYREIDSADKKREVLQRARRGDFLSFVFTDETEDTTHSGMFLAYDVSMRQGENHIWTIEGNAGNQVAIRHYAVNSDCPVVGHGGEL